MNIMNINNKAQSQFELFPEKSSLQHAAGQSRLLLKDLTVSIENIIVFFIIFTMFIVLSFAFGVERGKRLSLNNSTAIKTVEVTKTDTVLQNTKAVVKPQVVDLKKNTIQTVPSTTTKKLPVALPVVEEEKVISDLDEYTIQVASFKQKKSAELEANRLKAKGYEIYVLAKGSYSVVCIGKFIEAAKAKQFASRLKNKYKDCLVRRF